MPGFIYSPRPDDASADVETFYARKARQQSAAMAAKREANPVIPSLHQIYRDGDQVHQAQIQQRQAEIESSPYAFTGQGMAVAPGSKFAPSKDELVNGKKE